MNFSFWDINELVGPIDYLIVGSGITGLSTAIHLQQAMPRKHVVVFEGGMLPYGASTRNAGFTCFGSMGELVSDLQHHSEDEVLKLVEMRVKGLELLKKLVNPKFMQHQSVGNYELFTPAEKVQFQNLASQIPAINKLLHPIFKQEVFAVVEKSFGFAGANQYIHNRFEGMINSGSMMSGLLERAHRLGVRIYNGASVESYSTENEGVRVSLANGIELKAGKLAFCTNAFSGKFLPHLDLTPARNQVLITKPLKKQPFLGAFHMEEGHVYFRNFGKRVLIGGGRQHFPEENNTQEIATTPEVQAYLEKLLKTVILPRQNFEVEQRWAGIIGIGQKKTPIIENVGSNTFVAARLGGMGVALGSLLGKKLANKIISKK